MNLNLSYKYQPNYSTNKNKIIKNIILENFILILVRLIGLVGFVGLTGLLFPSLYSQATPSKSDLSLKNRLYTHQGQLLLDFHSKENLLNKKIISTLKHTIPIVFTFKIQLYQSKVLFDKLISTQIVTKVVEYDPWSEYYFLSTQGYTTKIDNILNLENNLLSIQNYPMTKASEINPSEDYFYQLTITTQSQNFYFTYDFINNLISFLIYPSINYKSPILKINL